jgi:hypothetical protein
MFATHGYFMKAMPPVHLSGSLNFSNFSSNSRVSFSGHFLGSMISGRNEISGVVARDEVSPGKEYDIVYDNPDFWQTFDPLQRNMMILAGANDRVHHVVRYLVQGQLLSPEQTSKLPVVGQETEREIDDGLLTAYEVLGMDLTGTDLVVLAGCESGLGVSEDSQDGTGVRQESESIVGLGQAFAMAGARSVATSMWEVPLDPTVQQMSVFLQAWLSGELPRYRAFHESQLSALHAARSSNLGGHPFWWAGFIYVGGPGDR